MFFVFFLFISDKRSYVFFFFFKQKTAYEMTCDWSSDVCSSDLRQRHVVGEERVRERDLALHALEEVTDDDETVTRRVQADASGGVARRVDDAQAAQDRQLIPLFDRLRVRWRTRQQRNDRSGREVRDHLAEPDAQALGVGRVKQDLCARKRPDLVNAADVVRMPVRADDAGDV